MSGKKKAEKLQRKAREKPPREKQQGKTQKKTWGKLEEKPRMGGISGRSVFQMARGGGPAALEKKAPGKTLALAVFALAFAVFVFSFEAAAIDGVVGEEAAAAAKDRAERVEAARERERAEARERARRRARAAAAEAREEAAADREEAAAAKGRAERVKAEEEEAEFNRISAKAANCVERVMEEYAPEGWEKAAAVSADADTDAAETGARRRGAEDEKDEEDPGTLKGDCHLAKTDAETCCLNPDKCAPISKRVLKVAAPLGMALATQIGSIKASVGGWDSYKYCQFNNIRGLAGKGGQSTLKLLDMMERGCSYGEKKCVEKCGAKVKDFKGEIEDCFSPLADFFELGGSVIDDLADLAEGKVDAKNIFPNDLSDHKRTLWEEDPNEIKQVIQRASLAYREHISRNQKDLRDKMEASDIVNCGETRDKFLHQRKTGNPEILKPFMMNFCRKVGEQTPPKPLTRPRPNFPSGPVGGTPGKDFTGGDSSPGKFKSSFSGGPGAAPTGLEDEFSSGDKNRPGGVKAAGLVYPGDQGAGSGSLPGGNLSGGDSGEGEEEEEENYGPVGDFNYKPPEAFEGGGDFMGAGYGGNLEGGIRSGSGSGRNKNSKDSGRSKMDLKKPHLPKSLDKNSNIFQIASEKIQEYCRTKIQEGCF